MIMVYVSLFLGLLFVGIAFLLNKDNAKYLLSGYNTMSEEQRKEFDLVGFLSYFRQFHLFLGISYVLIFLLLFSFDEDLSGGFIIFYPIVSYLYFILKSRRFYSRKTSNRPFLLGVTIMVLTLVGLSALIYSGYKENKIVLNKQSVQITGMYGTSVSYRDIAEVKLITDLPEINLKENGFAMGTISKGYFRLKKGGTVKLILNSAEKPILVIRTKKNEKVFYNSRNTNVKSVFEALNSKLKGL
jgi:hypothetical protein